MKRRKYKYFNAKIRAFKEDGPSLHEICVGPDGTIRVWNEAGYYAISHGISAANQRRIRKIAEEKEFLS